MDNLSITLPVDDWEFAADVLAAQAANYDVLKHVDATYASLAKRIRRIVNEIRQALIYRGRFETMAMAGHKTASPQACGPAPLQRGAKEGADG